MQKLIPVEDAVLRDTFWNAAIDLKKENDALKQRIKRLEEALETLTCVVGLTPILGNKEAMQEALDMARTVLKAKEGKP